MILRPNDATISDRRAERRSTGHMLSMEINAIFMDRLLGHNYDLPIATTLPRAWAVVGLVACRPQASINWRRFSNMSPRR